MAPGALIVNIAVILIIFTAWWIIYATVNEEMKTGENQTVAVQGTENIKNMDQTHSSSAAASVLSGLEM